ncbi:MAG: helix-hairpin-helix domain-containing protein [Cyclobacteriaceae bacterium]
MKKPASDLRNRMVGYTRRAFGYSATEARGFLVLIGLIIIVMLLPVITGFYYNNFYSMPEVHVQRLDSLVALISKKDSVKPQQSNLTTETFFFDPNTLGKDSLLLTGMHPFAVDNLLKYREKGGKIYQKKDILKIYYIDTLWYQQQKEFINLPSSSNSTKKIATKTKSSLSGDHETPSRLDLNKAEAEELKTVRGIGPVLSERIVKYRNLLGGFVSKDQLNEVYGLDDETLSNLKRDTFIDSDFVPRKSNACQHDANQLARHPYITKRLAMVLDSLCKSGHLPNQEAITTLINSEEYEKALPYIGF